MLFGLKLYWSPIDAVCAALIASFGAYLIYLAHPELSLLEGFPVILHGTPHA